MYRVSKGLLGLLLLPVPATAAQSMEPPPAAAAKPMPDVNGAYWSGNGVIALRLVYSADAEFSDAARRKKIQGRTVIALVVGIDGVPKDLRVTQSATEGQPPKLRKAAASLDEKALDAVRQYRFTPGSYDGKPVPVSINIDVNFHIY